MAQTRSSDIKVVRLEPTFEAFGLVTDLLAHLSPFSSFELGTYASSIQAQLRSGCNLAALRGLDLIGYAGWMMTSTTIAEDWVNGRGPLRPPRGEPAEAAVLTTVAVTDPRCTPLLIRGARQLNPGRRAYFKRDGGARGARKTSVLIVSSPGDQ